MLNAPIPSVIRFDGVAVLTESQAFALELSAGLLDLPFPLLERSFRKLAEAVEAATRETPRVSDLLLHDTRGRQWVVLVEPCGRSALASWELAR